MLSDCSHMVLDGGRTGFSDKKGWNQEKNFRRRWEADVTTLPGPERPQTCSRIENLGASKMLAVRLTQDRIWAEDVLCRVSGTE